MELTSAQNPKIKHLLLLQQKSQQRRREGLFVVEGRRELEHCLAAGYQADSLYLCEELCTQFSIPAGCQNVYAVPRFLYEKIAYRGSTEGIVAIVKEHRLTLADLPVGPSDQPTPAPLLVVLERVEKPGNLGAVLRSADAAGATAVIVCDPLTDLYNPNLIRSSIGALFSVPTVACSSEECIRFLQQHHVNILTAQLQDSRPYYHTDMRGPTAIVMGTESTGLTDRWRQAATAHIRIPMLGRLDSLNVSASAAILLFEAVRQRQNVK